GNPKQIILTLYLIIHRNAEASGTVILPVTDLMLVYGYGNVLSYFQLIYFAFGQHRYQGIQISIIRFGNTVNCLALFQGMMDDRLILIIDVNLQSGGLGKYRCTYYCPNQ